MKAIIKKELLSIRIPSHINKRLGEHVQQLGISKNAFVLNLINEELSKKLLTGGNHK